ncbi:SPOR domain-containing protein [Rhodobacter capsulatus]|uniref:Sporulation domain protein n=2 Tax=Rhodobacter capsulatus TaxID=1061 RepID=D5ASB9_RHOCB|nr:SPOR domain-containing protein [Rhodobacter capsulatus]ADE85010.1 sporulation domain protein [Rhodobacter capsulatus SB 1003]TQD37510.1 SPOR domain-containing protein [Rhodobacter capsulatus]
MTGSMRWVFALGAALTMAGCQLTGDGADPADAPKEGATPAATSARIVERDVEAPEVFSANDTGLWDGRPSLGGVWVAHPTVKDPERVIIRNPANGKFVIGALFRRERENPGPKLQVSSDAAAALDMLAGAPTKLSVVALRREEQADPAAATAPVKDALPPAENIAATPLASAPPRPGAKPAAAPPKGAGKPGAGKPGAEIAAAAGAAIAAAEAAPQKPAATPAKPAAAGKGLVQIGIFSQEANAKRAADQLKKSGIASTIRTETAKGKTFWRVVAGPAGSAADRTALLTKIKGLGFPDAYAVSR